MTDDGFPEDDEPKRPARKPPADPFAFNPPPRVQGDLSEMEPYVRPIHYHQPTKAEGKSNARMFLWLTWVACTGFYLLMSFLANFAGHDPITLTHVTRLLTFFFLFYAIDRIIG